MNERTRIKSAEFLEDYKIRIRFSDGHINVYDYEPLVMRTHSENIPYRSIDSFKQFHIVLFKDSIGWGEGDAMALPIKELYHKKKFSMLPKKVGKNMKAEKDYYILKNLPKNQGFELYHWMMNNYYRPLISANGELCSDKDTYESWLRSKEEQKEMKDKKRVMLERDIPKEHYKAFTKFMTNQSAYLFEKGKTIGFNRNDYEKWLGSKEGPSNWMAWD